MSSSSKITLLLFIAILGGYAALHQYKQATQPVFVVRTFDELFKEAQLTSLNGEEEEHLFVELQGKVKVVHFWAHWCEACKVDEPYLQRIAAEFKGEDVFKMVGIASLDDAKGREPNGVYPLVVDKYGVIARGLGVSTLPQTVVFDGAGRLRFHEAGTLDEPKVRELRAILWGLVKEAALGVESLADAGVRKTDELLPIYGKIPDFSLQDSGTRLFTQGHLKDHIWVADFIFTGCQSICPLITEKMQGLARTFDAESGLKLLSISVDPVHDTPQVLRTYKDQHKIEDDRWSFVTGEWANIRTLLIDGFKISAPTDPVFHSDKLVLIDQARQIRGYYSATSPEALDRLRADIAHLRDHKVTESRLF